MALGITRTQALRLLAVAGFAATLSTTAVQAQDKVSIRTDWFHSHYHAPFFVGIEKGFYKEVNLEVAVTEGRGSGQVITLVGKGDDQFGFAATEAIMRGVAKDVPVISVANVMPVMGQAIYVLNKKADIKGPADLKGKTMAITPGGTNEALLPAVLQNVGLKEADVKQVAVDPAAKVRMFMNGDFDAMMATAWSNALFEPVGGAKMFIYSDFGVKIVGYNIVANADLTKRNPDLVKRFVGATMKAWEYAKANPKETQAILAKMSEPNSKPDVLKRNEADFPDAIKFVGASTQGQPLGFHNQKDWEMTQDVLLQYKVLDEKRPITQYFTNQFVPGARLTN
ncbi:MAG: ABC transporter substrate-binding protein [Alphaproteobacteria bacterium]|nr:ABC transporter substrate-binding protein [Alphaproteobacteria bacterium]